METAGVYPTVITTVDIVLFTLKDDALHVLLHKRPNAPYAGQWALPGGFIFADQDYNSLDTAKRILATKCQTKSPYFEQLGTFASSTRDPRGWSISIAYMAVLPTSYFEGISDDAVLVESDKVPGLAFDHGDILQQALSRLRSKASYSSLPTFLLADHFTMAQLHNVYEKVLGTSLNLLGFRRKVLALDMLITHQEKLIGKHRPATTYSRKPGLMLFDRGFGGAE